jgi:predicted ester cyclase
MQEFRGHEEIKASFEMDRGAFSDYTETVEEMIAEGDIVALRLSERGTHDGPLQGIEPTGNAFEIQTMAFLRLEGGKVVEWWIQPDMLGFLQQLEVDPEDLGAAVSAEDD